MADSLVVEQRSDLGMASVMGRNGIDPAAIGRALYIEMPVGPRASFAGRRTVIGTGPGTWLVIEDGAAADFADALEEELVGLASVSDQSSGYVVQRLSGAGAPLVLQRGAAIDFHPSVFGAGSAATTVIAHIGVIIWQVDARPTYDVATFRSFAGSFRHWLDASAAAL